MADPMKNDFQNARRRGLHGWAQWRTDINARLSESNQTGAPLPDMDSIHAYIGRQLPRHHPASNPRMLMSYSADTTNSTCLQKDNYLIYGIPRAKVGPPGRAGISQSAADLTYRPANRYSGGSDSSNGSISTGSSPDRNGFYRDHDNPRKTLPRTHVTPEVARRPEHEDRKHVSASSGSRDRSRWKDYHAMAPRADYYDDRKYF